jgi:hypothetical protein
VWAPSHPAALAAGLPEVKADGGGAETLSPPQPSELEAEALRASL